MSKYVVSWADDTESLHLSVSVYDTLEDARECMVRYWNELLETYELPEGTTEFDMSEGIRWGSQGSIGEMWLTYRNEEGCGDEVEITEV